jgi:hypothetical protein
MRRVLVLVLLAAVVVPLAAPASTARARLWIPDRSPLVVRGAGFAAHERVVVTVSAGSRFVHTVYANAVGSFVTQWTSEAAVKAGCNAIFVRAAGNRGTLATYKVAGIECPQPPADPGQ